MESAHTSSRWLIAARLACFLWTLVDCILSGVYYGLHDCTERPSGTVLPELSFRTWLLVHACLQVVPAVNFATESCATVHNKLPPVIVIIVVVVNLLWLILGTVAFDVRVGKGGECHRASIAEFGIATLTINFVMHVGWLLYLMYLLCGPQTPGITDIADKERLVQQPQAQPVLQVLKEPAAPQPIFDRAKSLLREPGKGNQPLRL